MNNTEHIQWLKEEVARGESSLDTLQKVYGCLKITNPKLLELFEECYEEYSAWDNQLPEELLQEVYTAMAAAPQYVPYDRNAGTNNIMDSLQ